MIFYIAILLPIFIPLFWAIVLYGKSKDNTPRKFLAFFMIAASMLYFGHALYFAKNLELFNWYDSVYSTVSLMIYPMYYIYTRLLTQDIKLDKKTLIHFASALIVGLSIFVATLAQSKAEMDIYIAQYLKNLLYIPLESKSLIIKKLLYISSRIIYAIQVLVYTILIVKTIRKHHLEIKNTFSNNKYNRMFFGNYLIATILLISLTGIITNIISKENVLQFNNYLIIPSLIYSTLIFIIGYFGNYQNKIPQDLIDELRFSKKDFPEKENEIIDNLEEKIKSQKLFIDPELNIKELAILLNTSTNNILHTLTNKHKTTFFDFINKLRVEEIETILSSDEPNTSMEDLANKSGFCNTLSMQQTFRKKTGKNLNI